MPRRARRMAARQTHRRQAGALVENARDDLPQRQLALPIRAQGGDDAEVAGQLRQQPNRPHRGTFWTNSSALSAAAATIPARSALCRSASRIASHFLRLAMGEVGDRAVLDLAGFAIRISRSKCGAGRPCR